MTQNDHIWIRYLSFQWMFQDANVSEMYQRAAAIRHNQRMRPMLLVYLKRWMIVTLLCFMMGAFFESRHFVVCVVFYTMTALSTCTMSKLGAAWFLLGHSK